MILMTTIMAAAAAAASCPLPDGWDAVAASHPHYVILGEIHGTVESPAFVGDLACALVERHERLLVALEQDSTNDAALQLAWRLPPAEFESAVGNTLGWRGRMDGNGSMAIRALLIRLQAMKARGAPINIVAFNGARDEAQAARFRSLPGQGPHEAAQADNIVQAVNADRYDRVIVLVGNLHASKAPVKRGGTQFEPMAMRLASAGPSVSLQMLGGAGSTWSCQAKPGVTFQSGQPIPSDTIECGPHLFRGISNAARSPSILIGRQPDGTVPDFVYDGYVWLGSTTASPPALP